MKPRALIVGLGIAGMASAISLKKNGWEPVIIERAPQRRTGGYFIGLNDIGRGAAEALGVTGDIHTRTPRQSANWHLTRDGSRVRVMGFADQPGRPDTLLRGDIEEGLWHAVENGVEVRFGSTIVSAVNEADQVRVVLRTADGKEIEESFDLVVGADGLRSTVRSLVFGPHDQFMHSMDTIICAYQLQGEVETFRQRDGFILAEKGRALWVFPLEDHTPTALFTYRTKNVDGEFGRPPAERLREVYAGLDAGGVVAECLDDLEQSDGYLFDSVHQVRMDNWSKGRVVLVGDAAWCLTLFSGVGASMGMKGGYELGESLGANPQDVDQALAQWQATLRPLVAKERRVVGLKSQLFVPSSGAMSVLRRMVLRLGGRFLIRLSQGRTTAKPISKATGTVQADLVA